MKKQLGILLVGLIIMAPAVSQAAQFVVVGPRALGMGGASVAAVNDSTAVYWNPAALARFRKVDIRIPVIGAGLHDQIGLRDKWDEISDIYDQINAGTVDPTLLDRLDQLLTDLEAPNAVTDLDAHAGVLFTIPAGTSALAFSALGLGYAGIYPTIDTLNRNTTLPPSPPTDSITTNNSAVTAVALASLEPAISFATSFGDRLFLGANAKMMFATTYVHSEIMRTGDFDDFLDNLDASEQSSNEFSLDAGILLAPVKSLSLGVVGRYLNSPSFLYQGTIAQQDSSGDVTLVSMPFPAEIEIEPQYRAGIAWKPFSFLTLSADYDLSKNKNLLEEHEYQTLAGGFELTLPKEIISLRGGAYTNRADKEANVVYTAGLGIRIFFIRIDAAAAYDFEEKNGQVSANLALRF